MQCSCCPLTVLTLFRSKDLLSPRPALRPAMMIYNMGWVFATRSQEGLSPTPTLWWPDSFYFTFLYHCQNAYPLIRFLAFITGGHQMDLNSFRNNQFAFGLCSKMPSHYSFPSPSVHSIIFQCFLKTIPLILETVDQLNTTEQPWASWSTTEFGGILLIFKMNDFQPNVICLETKSLHEIS